MKFLFWALCCAVGVIYTALYTGVMMKVVQDNDQISDRLVIGGMLSGFFLFGLVCIAGMLRDQYKSTRK